MRAFCAGACVCPDLSGLILLHLCMDFKIICHSCCPWGGEVPFEKYILGRLKIKVTLEGHMNELFWAIAPSYKHVSMDFKIILHRCSP